MRFGDVVVMLANGERTMELWGRETRKLRRSHVGSRRKRTETPAGAMTRPIEVLMERCPRDAFRRCNGNN